MGIVHAVSHVVDNHIIEHTRLFIFMLDIEIHPRHTVVKHALWYIRFRCILKNGKTQLQQILLCLWGYIILEIE